MTTVKLLDGTVVKPELKKIEFLYWFSGDPEARLNGETTIDSDTSSWSTMTLIAKNYRKSDLDLIYGQSDHHVDCLFIGHFNDGVL